MKPVIRKLVNTGDYDRYLIKYQGNQLIRSLTYKWGGTLEIIHLAAAKMKREIDLVNS
jgi:hypothetical protein